MCVRARAGKCQRLSNGGGGGEGKVPGAGDELAEDIVFCAWVGHCNDFLGSRSVYGLA